MKPRIPHPKGIVLRLAGLVVAAALAVGMQASEGRAANSQAPAARPPPVQTESCGALATARAAQVLRHPALLPAAQPSAARSSASSKPCSLPARSRS